VSIIMDNIPAEIYIGNRFEIGIDLPFIPNSGDRIVLPADRYMGYMVSYREIILKEDKQPEIKIHCKLDK
jgi:hypothetical protein